VLGRGVDGPRAGEKEKGGGVGPGRPGGKLGWLGFSPLFSFFLFFFFSKAFSKESFEQK